MKKNLMYILSVLALICMTMTATVAYAAEDLMTEYVNALVYDETYELIDVIHIYKESLAEEAVTDIGTPYAGYWISDSDGPFISKDDVTRLTMTTQSIVEVKDGNYVVTFTAPEYCVVVESSHETVRLYCEELRSEVTIKMVDGTFGVIGSAYSAFYYDLDNPTDDMIDTLEEYFFSDFKEMQITKTTLRENGMEILFESRSYPYVDTSFVLSKPASSDTFTLSDGSTTCVFDFAEGNVSICK